MGMAAQCGNDERSKVTRNLETSMVNLALIVLALLFFPCSLPAQGLTPNQIPPQGERDHRKIKGKA
jgi:hypothetical protein